MRFKGSSLTGRRPHAALADATRTAPAPGAGAIAVRLPRER